MRKSKKAFFLGITVGGAVGQAVGVSAHSFGIDFYTFIIWLALILLVGTYYFEEYLNREA